MTSIPGLIKTPLIQERVTEGLLQYTGALWRLEDTGREARLFL